MLQGHIGAEDWIATSAVLLNALLTLIAGTRLWSHIFWRGAAERARLPMAPMAASVLLTTVVAAMSLAPALLIWAAQVAARDVLDPLRYIASVGLSP
jgi:multicomponent Na+:H+ antiporter subunit D